MPSSTLTQGAKFFKFVEEMQVEKKTKKVLPDENMDDDTEIDDDKFDPSVCSPYAKFTEYSTETLIRKNLGRVDTNEKEC